MISKRAIDKTLTCLVFVAALLSAIGSFSNKNLIREYLGEKGENIVNILLVVLISYLTLSMIMDLFY